MRICLRERELKREEEKIFNQFLCFLFKDCDCDHSGTEPGVCSNETGTCMCRSNFDGSRCDRCFPGFYGFPACDGNSVIRKDV